MCIDCVRSILHTFEPSVTDLKSISLKLAMSRSRIESFDLVRVCEFESYARTLSAAVCGVCEEDNNIIIGDDARAESTSNGEIVCLVHLNGDGLSGASSSPL